MKTSLFQLHQVDLLQLEHCHLRHSSALSVEATGLQYVFIGVKGAVAFSPMLESVVKLGLNFIKSVPLDFLSSITELYSCSEIYQGFFTSATFC